MTDQEEMYLTWNNNTQKTKILSQAYQDYRPSTSRSVSFRDIDTNVSARQGFTNQHYDFFRPEEAVPSDIKNIIGMCMSAYNKVGIVRNYFDLMSDFACQGIKLVHPSKRIEKFYTNWFNKVSGKERSERFLNYLYRCGQVPVKRSFAKISVGDTEKLYKGMASVDLKMEVIQKPGKREIPIKYRFINPLALEIVVDDLQMFVDNTIYGISIPTNITKRLQYPKKEDEAIIAQIPNDIRESILKNGKIIFGQDKFSIYFYKKDDWLKWSIPLLYPVLRDLVLFEKMKLADKAALDGAISRVRLWTLGSLDHKIIPTSKAINALNNILTNNVGGGTIDLIWGPELQLKESSSDVYKFLGEEKYRPVLSNIYQGLGIPVSLTGEGSSGMTNNFVSLKTLIERLQYGRDRLTEFWEHEIKLVQMAMGFRKPAQVRFTRMTLSDEASEKALWVQLADRNFISVETLQERFGEIPEIEEIRNKREFDRMEKGKMVRKAGPWNNPNPDHEFKKILLQRGVVTPSEIGLELEERKDGEKTAVEILNDLKVPESKLPDQPSKGRPRNSKDRNKRKQRVPIPTSAIMWANSAQKQIADIVNPVFLEMCQKSNLRMLTNSQQAELDNTKLSLLHSFSMGEELSEDTILNKLSNLKSGKEHSVFAQYCKAFFNKFNRHPTFDEMTLLRSLVYVSIREC